MPNIAIQDAMREVINYLMLEFIERATYIKDEKNQDKLSWVTWDALNPDIIDANTKKVTPGSTANSYQKDLADRADVTCEMIMFLTDPVKFRNLLEIEKDPAATTETRPTSAQIVAGAASVPHTKSTPTVNANKQIIEYLQKLDAFIINLSKKQNNSRGRPFEFAKSTIVRAANVMSFGWVPGTVNYINHCWAIKRAYEPFITPDFIKRAEAGSLRAEEDLALKDCWRTLQETAKRIKEDVFTYIVDPNLDQQKPTPEGSAVINKDVGIVLIARLFAKFFNTSSYFIKVCETTKLKTDLSTGKTFDEHSKQRIVDLVSDWVKIQTRMTDRMNAPVEGAELKDWVKFSQPLTKEITAKHKHKYAHSYPTILDHTELQAVREAVAFLVNNKITAQVGTTQVPITTIISDFYRLDCVEPLKAIPPDLAYISQISENYLNNNNNNTSASTVASSSSASSSAATTHAEEGYSSRLRSTSKNK